MVPRRDHDEVVLALAVAGAVRLRRGEESRSAQAARGDTAAAALIQEQRLKMLLPGQTLR